VILKLISHFQLSRTLYSDQTVLPYSGIYRVKISGGTVDLAGARPPLLPPGYGPVWRPLANKSTANQRKEHIVEKYIQWVIRRRSQYRSIFIRLAFVVASQIGKILQKFTLIAVQGHNYEVIDLGATANRKRVCNFILGINGVIITSDLKSSQQCSQSQAKANRILGWCLNELFPTNLQSLNIVGQTSWRVLHSSLSNAKTRNHHHGCPHYQKDKKLLEKVQRRFTPMIPLCHTSSESSD